MANDYAVGQQVKLSGFFSTLTNVGTDPTAIVLKVQTPNGTETTWTYGVDSQVVKTATGDYYAYWTIDAAGTHYFKWSGTGALVGANETSFIGRATQF